MDHSEVDGRTAIARRLGRYPPGIAWLTLDALDTLRACPNYPHALVTYIAVLEASDPYVRGPAYVETTRRALCPDLTDGEVMIALDALTTVGLVDRFATPGGGMAYGLEGDLTLPESEVAEERSTTVSRRRGPCVYCGGQGTHDDHVLAKSKGGKRKGNLVPACAPCNISKGAHDVREWVERKGFDWPTIEARILAHGVTP